MWGSESSRFQSDWAASPTSFTTCCIHSSPHKLALILTHGFHWQMLHGSGLSNILRSPLQLRLNFPQWLLRACMQGFWYWHEVPSHSYSDPLNAEFFLPSKPAPWEQPLLIAKALWKLEMTPPPWKLLCGIPEEIQCSYHHNERRGFHLHGAGLLISQLLLLPQLRKNIHFPTNILHEWPLILALIESLIPSETSQARCLLFS